jgi:hypothetical protein
MSTTLATVVSLKHILERPGDFSGWAFSEDTKDAGDDAVSAIARQPGWHVALDSATIEDIVINAHDQIDEPSAAQLFDAFVFYVDNDAFILF